MTNTAALVLEAKLVPSQQRQSASAGMSSSEEERWLERFLPLRIPHPPLCAVSSEEARGSSDEEQESGADSSDEESDAAEESDDAEEGSSDEAEEGSSDEAESDAGEESGAEEGSDDAEGSEEAHGAPEEADEAPPEDQFPQISELGAAALAAAAPKPLRERIEELPLSQQIRGIGRECEAAVSASVSELSLKPQLEDGLSSLDIIRVGADRLVLE